TSAPPVTTGVNTTVGAWPTATPSVVSVAVSVTVSAVLSVTVNDAWPCASVATDGGDTAPAPVDATLTLRPPAALPKASTSVTVTIDADTPSAGTVAGDAVTVDSGADAAAATTVTGAFPELVCVATSEAETVCAPAVTRVRFPVPWPADRAKAAGSVAPASVELRCTVPV